MLLTLLWLAGPTAAQTPQLPYHGYPMDEAVALDGTIVRPPAEAAMELLYALERERVRETQPYAPAPAIWRIADADTTIYLFGTIHSLPIGFRWRNPGLEAVILRADSLLLESVEEETEGIDLMLGLAGRESMPPLQDRISPRYHAKLAAFQRTLPAALVEQMDAMPTWAAALSVSAVRDMLAGEVSAQGADDWLEHHFRSVGKPVEAIEDSGSVVESINAVPEAAQRRMLEAALITPARRREVLEGPAHAWARGEVGPDSPLIIMPEDLDPSSALADPMLTRRNAAWVEELIARLDSRSGVILFAAGAGHFVGSGSVLEMLETRGVAIERVQ